MFVLKFVLFLSVILTVTCVPTLYKKNEFDNLEPDMIAVSSTVIPLPVYEVGAGYGPKVYRKQYNKVHKPDGPVKLITVYNQNKDLSEKKKE